MNELQTFTNDVFGQIRTTIIDGEPWFVGNDIAAALGYSNTRDAVRTHVDIEDRADVAIHDGAGGHHRAVPDRDAFGDRRV